jgi:hypothetical protein
MKVSEYPGCCTAVVLSGFGNSQTGMRGHDVPAGGHSPEEFERLVKYKLDYCLRDMGKAIVTCTLTDEQDKEAKVLKKLGFKHSRWISKRAHKETRLRLYWKEADNA